MGSVKFHYTVVMFLALYGSRNACAGRDASDYSYFDTVTDDIPWIIVEVGALHSLALILYGPAAIFFELWGGVAEAIPKKGHPAPASSTSSGTTPTEELRRRAYAYDPRTPRNQHDLDHIAEHYLSILSKKRPAMATTTTVSSSSAPSTNHQGAEAAGTVKPGLTAHKAIGAISGAYSGWLTGSKMVPVYEGNLAALAAKFPQVTEYMLKFPSLGRTPQNLLRWAVRPAHAMAGAYVGSAVGTWVWYEHHGHEPVVTTRSGARRD